MSHLTDERLLSNCDIPLINVDHSFFVSMSVSQINLYPGPVTLETSMLPKEP